MEEVMKSIAALSILVFALGISNVQAGEKIPTAKSSGGSYCIKKTDGTINPNYSTYGDCLTFLGKQGWSPSEASRGCTSACISHRF